jgi:hypothetical protein
VVTSAFVFAFEDFIDHSLPARERPTSGVWRRLWPDHVVGIKEGLVQWPFVVPHAG